MASSSSSSNSGVPPGFRFHPTDEELLLYYLKKKISSEKFDLEVIRDVDLNKMEPWDLQERCRIGSAAQNEWYFFSHKDRKYPTGSRTNRATGAGFWKATGRDKCIRTAYKKIGMRKTLVFYRGRAPHGQKTDWIMHEYRLDDSDDPHALAAEDGWVVCRVFKKKCFFKLSGGGDGSANQAGDGHLKPEAGHELSPALALGGNMHYFSHHPHHHHHHYANLYKSPEPPPEPAPAMQYWQQYPHGQAQDLLQNRRPALGAFEFSGIPGDSSAMAAAEVMEQVGAGRHPGEWAVLDGVEERFGGTGAAAEQMEEMAGQRGGEMDLWGYGK